MKNLISTIKDKINDIGFAGKSLISISDLSDKQLYGLFDLAKTLEPWNRSRLDLALGAHMSTLFFQPSTRTRMSFETAMLRLGGTVISEANPKVTSSAAKEESLNDMIKVVSQYANIIVLRHPDADEATEGASYADCPVINGGFGHREHPTQALLDLYTLWRTYGRIEGLKVCVASPDLIEARTGHSMAKGLARLGAKLYLASTSDRRTPADVMADISAMASDAQEVLDLNADHFNEFISDMDLVYLPGCSAPAGADADAFKCIMDSYFVRYETVEKALKERNKTIYVTHTLPRRAGEMDLRIDASPAELYFKAIGYSVSIRSALILAMIDA